MSERFNTNSNPIADAEKFAKRVGAVSNYDKIDYDGENYTIHADEVRYPDEVRTVEAVQKSPEGQTTERAVVSKIPFSDGSEIDTRLILNGVNNADGKITSGSEYGVVSDRRGLLGESVDIVKVDADGNRYEHRASTGKYAKKLGELVAKRAARIYTEAAKEKGPDLNSRLHRHDRVA